MWGLPQHSVPVRTNMPDPLWSRFQDRLDRIDVTARCGGHTALQEVARLAGKGDLAHGSLLGLNADSLTFWLPTEQRTDSLQKFVTRAPRRLPRSRFWIGLVRAAWGWPI